MSTLIFAFLINIYASFGTPDHSVSQECYILDALKVVKTKSCKVSGMPVYHENGQYAGSSGNKWFYDNGELAGEIKGKWFHKNNAYAGKIGDRWYHENGNIAGVKDGRWLYSNGQYAGANGNKWYDSSGKYVATLNQLRESEALRIVFLHLLDNK